MGPAEYAGGAAGADVAATLAPMTLRQRLLRVVPITLAGTLVVWSTTLDNSDACRGMGECLGDAFADLAVLAAVLLAAPVALRLAGVPRVLAHWLLLGVVGALAWGASDALLAVADPARPHDAALPGPVVVGFAVLTALVASYAAGPGGRMPARVLAPVVVVAVALAAGAWSDRVDRDRRVTELEELPVDLYEPRVLDTRPSNAFASGDHAVMSWTGLRVAGRTAYLRVELRPVPAGSLCEELLTFAEPTCTEDGSTMRNDSTNLSDLAVVRGGTVLLAQYDREELAPDVLVQALREAPVVPAEELVD